MIVRWIAVVLCGLAIAGCTSQDEPAADEGPPASPADGSSEEGSAAEPSPADPSAGAGADAEETATFNRIVDQVADLRELSPTEDVPVELVEPEELAEHALDSSTDALEHLQEIEAILGALHQIPDGADLSELLEEVVSLAAVGLYDPEAGRAYLVSDGDALSPGERSVVAHEAVHALQDQHFDLGRLSDLDDDPDAAMAFRSVVEGDAVVVEEQWADAHLSDEEQQQRRAEELEAGAEQLEALQELPPAVVESFIVPYTVGPEFVRDVRQPGGWSAVDEVIAEPPQTMVEVLEPDLRADGFTPVDLDPGRDPAGWDPLEQLPWGAFEVLLLMDLADGHTPDRPVATAWRGGQLAAWRRDDAVAVAVAWAFASPADADRVCDVVADWHATAADSQPAGDGLYRGPDDVLRLECEGDTVRFVVAPDADTAAEISSG